jgi:hypothetical protein
VGTRRKSKRTTTNEIVQIMASPCSKNRSIFTRRGL